ncbi:hypothetical protein [Agromyces mariniharenae]|uniref:Uncharacterized protein n=1 Tax=Agromyces mariniharenae TaxID=2604423 RepID=A0A5S4UXU1_9MICO|nr:hypothetical protein [Agromyces mariniharenae]TYL50433.1 hypothetical protein FYC51_14595 [Agromyces mariniharenae]
MEEYEPTDVDIARAEQEAADGVFGWSCNYDPSYNEDWHDDVRCNKGAEVIRPYLREWDDFVTEAELMESAREYEAKLNAGG